MQTQNTLSTLVVVASVALCGCAGIGDTQAPTFQAFSDTRGMPKLPPVRNLTPFSEGLVCMDKLVKQNAVRGSILVEDLADKTTKSPAGISDMVLTALAQATRGSGTEFRIVAYGGDTRNLIELMRQSGSKDAYDPAKLPTLAVRGSVSQYDENLAKATVDAGISLGPFKKWVWGVGHAKSTSVNQLALDMHMIDTRDFSVVPGASAFNVAAVVQDGSGIDAEVTYANRIGANFGRSVAKSEGRAAAVRNLVELGTIELLGRWAKLPYWRCLSVPDDSLDVAAEVDGWFESMSTAQKLSLLLKHFRLVGMFPENGEVEASMFKLAYQHYAQALGANPETLSRKMFRAHFANDAFAVGEHARKNFEIAKLQLPMAEISYSTRDRGQAGEFVLLLNQVAYLHCFVQADDGMPFLRLPPSRQALAERTPARRALNLRELVTQRLPSTIGTSPTLACLATKDERGQEIANLWAGYQRAGGQQNLAAINQLRYQLNMQGGFASLAVAAVKQSSPR